MSILVVTNKGKFVIDLHCEESPRECLNFIKLCQCGFYDRQFFYNLNKGFIVQTGNPQYQTKSTVKETSIWGLSEGKSLLSQSESSGMRHDKKGVVSFVSASLDTILVGSQIMITLSDDTKLLSSLDKKGVVIGEIVEGEEILDLFNKTVVDDNKRPLEDIIILHTYVIEDPFSDEKFDIRSANVNGIDINDLRFFVDHESKEITELNSKLLTLEMIGDFDSSIQPSEKVLFICKLNPVTKEADLQIIFQRFGKVVNIEIIKDKFTGKSLNYGFIEFDTKDACELLYLKMDNVLIDDRRIHVDFSQSISKQKLQLRRDERYPKRDRSDHRSERHRPGYRSDNHRSDNHRSDRHRSDHRADSHRWSHHRSDNHRLDHRSDYRSAGHRSDHHRSDYHRSDSHRSDSHRHHHSHHRDDRDRDRDRHTHRSHDDRRYRDRDDRHR